MLLCFTAPKDLAGLELSIEGETATFYYREMQFSQPLNTMPRANFAFCFSQAMLQLAQSGQGSYSYTRKGGWSFRGTVNGLLYNAKLEEDGALKRIEVPMIGLRIDLIYQPKAL